MASRSGTQKLYETLLLEFSDGTFSCVWNKANIILYVTVNDSCLLGNAFWCLKGATCLGLTF
jgi:hypothetical protein